MVRNEVRERMLLDGPRALSDGDLLSMLGADTAADRPLSELAWLNVGELRLLGLGQVRAALVAAAFELGRRGAWSPPKRGERCLDPSRVFELMRPLAHAPVEEFHVVLLDVRGRILRTERVAQGSVSQCPVAPRDVFRPPVREGAHGVVFVHNHPSGGSPEPSVEDVALTDRLREAAELVGVVARDHVIVATGGYFSFVEAGRWRR
ncbi:MAG: DNA repair protein RadC [Deltaproteobacteria bacterium]|nr:DNA repair protein RadC [Deltaproteobacteria bacterium]